TERIKLDSNSAHELALNRTVPGCPNRIRGQLVASPITYRARFNIDNGAAAKPEKNTRRKRPCSINYPRISEPGNEWSFNGCDLDTTSLLPEIPSLPISAQRFWYAAVIESPSVFELREPMDRVSAGHRKQPGFLFHE